jgi:hypothetical protein
MFGVGVILSYLAPIIIGLFFLLSIMSVILGEVVSGGRYSLSKMHEDGLI